MVKPPHTDEPAPAVRPLQHYMLCRDAERVDEWERRRSALPGVDLRLMSGFASMYAFIAAAIRESDADHVVVSHDDVIMGRNFAARVRDLVAELDVSVPRWGLAGNAGVGIDGKSYHVHVKDPWSEPARSASPQPVLTLDGNLLLIHRRAYIDAGCEYPDLGGFHGYDLVLALECLRKGLLVVADRRLVAIHLSGGNKGAYAAFNASETFRGYLRARFSNRIYPTMLGPVTLPVDDAKPASRTDDLHDLYDRALLNAGDRRRSLTVVHLADDARASMGPREMDFAPMRLLVDVEHVHVRVDAARTLGGCLAEAIASATTDYVWPLPVGVHVEYDALRQVARSLAVGIDRVVSLGHHVVPEAGGEPVHRAATSIVRAAFGSDAFPFWAALYPADVVRARIDEADLPLEQLPALLPVLAVTASRADLVIVHAAVVSGTLPATPPLPRDGYGSDAQWELVTRLGATLGSRAFGSSTLWNLAEAGVPLMWNPEARASLGTPSPVIHAAITAGRIVDAGLHVLRKPRKYMKRSLEVFVHHLIRGDVKGLVQEIISFRGR